MRRFRFPSLILAAVVVGLSLPAAAQHSPIEVEEEEEILDERVRPSEELREAVRPARGGTIPVRSRPARSDGAVGGVETGAESERSRGEARPERRERPERRGSLERQERAAAPSGAGQYQRPVQAPVESAATVAQHWNRRVSHLEARDAQRAAEQEEQIARVQELLDLENLFTVGAALVREGEALLKTGQAARALERCQFAAKVAPQLVAAHLCSARAGFSANMTQVGPVLDSLGKAFLATFGDVRTRRGAVADLLVTLLAGLALASIALVVLVVFRYAPLVLHDLNHFFPKGTSRWLSTMLALVLLVLPAALGGGVLVVLALAVLGVSLLLTRKEAVAVAVAAVLVLGAQLGLAFALKLGVVGQVASDVYLLERGDAPAPSAARLESLLESGQADYAVAFALGRYHKRFGRYDQAQTAYEEAQKHRETAQVLNNLGTVRFLQGDSQEAQELYRQATEKTALASPWYNLAKLYFREGRLEQGQEAQRRSVALDGDRVRAQGFQDDPRANLFLMDEKLSDSDIEALTLRETESVPWMAALAWEPLTGRLPVTVVLGLPLFIVLVVLLGQWGQRKVRPSSQCEKCGRPVCSRCDPEQGTTTGICGQCITVFVRRTGVDAPDRIRKEIEVSRYHRRYRFTTRLLGVLLAGAGHLFSGRLLGGAVFLSLFSLFASQLLLRGGLFRPPVAVEASVSPFFFGTLGVLLAVTWAASLFHLVRHEEGS